MQSLFDKKDCNFNGEQLKENVNPYELEAQMLGLDEFTVDGMDKYLTDQVQLDHNGIIQRGIIKSRESNRSAISRYVR